MRNAGLDEAHAGIKIAGRNINNLRYAEDTTLMAVSKEELKSLLIKLKEKSEKSGLILNIHKMKIMASGHITPWHNVRFHFLEPQKIKSVAVSIVSPSISHEMMGPDAMFLVFSMLSFKPTFPLSSFTFIKRPFSCSSLSIIRVVLSVYHRNICDISPSNLDSSLCFIQPGISHNVLCI